MSLDQRASAPVKYRPEIDGLRAVAVSAVIANHFDKSLLPGGYLGVDIFFVISGYVITASLMQDKSSNLSEFLMTFYVRRIKRLLPPLLTCIIITVLLGALFIDPSSFKSSLRAGLYALVGLSNFYFIAQETDYFATSAELNLFTHTWSLGVEEQFYLVYPTLFWLALRGRGTHARQLQTFTALLIILIVLSWLGDVWLTRTSFPGAYFRDGLANLHSTLSRFSA
jgi:peptidoglycan/LPS O-acetylase OafA/YrhL